MNRWTLFLIGYTVQEKETENMNQQSARLTLLANHLSDPSQVKGTYSTTKELAALKSYKTVPMHLTTNTI